MTLTTHLNFNGNCEAAMTFYEKHLGAKTTFTIKYGTSPMADQFPADYADKIMHCSVELAGTSVIAADSPPDRYERPAGFTLTLGFDNAEEAQRVFNALAENGTVTMPLQKTFWAAQFGMVIDQFDIPWMVNCADPAITS
jgi:PhnB protein